MTEKLKYKVGDKVLVEAEVMGVLEGDDSPYRIHINGFYHWMDREFVEQNDLNLPPKPKIPQAVMDWYESHKRSHWNVRDYFVHTPEEIDDWLSVNLQNEHAFVTLITYGPQAVEVEKEKRYRVYLVGVKNQWNQRQCLTNHEDNYFFSGRCATDTTFTKQELIDAGFEGVFDNPMFEVDEVE